MARTFDEAGLAFDESGVTFDDLEAATLSPRALWLKIVSPLAYIYGSPDVLPQLPAGARRLRLLQTVGDVQADIEGETPTLIATLLNRSGQARRVFSRPPLGAQVELHNIDGLLFAGTLAEVALGGSAQLRIEA